MLRTPLAIVNKAQSRPASPGAVKGTTPFAPRPKIQRSPTAGAENAPDCPTPSAVDFTYRTEADSLLTGIDRKSSARVAPVSVIKVQPPTPLTRAPTVLLTVVKPALLASFPIVDTPLTTPSRRLAPHEFQEYIKHFRSPVDRLVSPFLAALEVCVPLIAFAIVRNDSTTV